MFEGIRSLTIAFVISLGFSHFVFAEVNNTEIDYIKADNFKEFITDYTLLKGSIYVMETCNGALLARYAGTDLMKSTDYGINWDFLYGFEKPISAIFCDDQNNIFVSLSFDRWDSVGSGEIYKSQDGGLSFYKVLNIEAGVPLNWNFSAREGTMFVSEYGYKGKGNNARRIYRSLDYGDNWEVVYTPQSTVGYHSHKIILCEDGSVYQSIGDDENAKIIKSMDNGLKWFTVIKRYHPTSAVETDSHIIWGLDSGPVSGIARLNKQSGKISSTFVLPSPYNGSCYDIAEANDILYAVFVSYEGSGHPGSIWYSRDYGVTWKLLGRIEKEGKYGVGLYNLTLDDKHGYIDFQAPIYHDGDAEVYHGTLRFELLESNL